jgi:hypothetical protein
VGRELSRAATHVDAREGVLSDAGSTPAASTIIFFYRLALPISTFPVSTVVELPESTSP